MPHGVPASLEHPWSSWHPPCLGLEQVAGAGEAAAGEGRSLRGVTSFEGPAVPPGGLLASEGAPSLAAGARGLLPWGNVSAGQGAAPAVCTGPVWLSAWGNASSLGCFVTGGWGSPGGDLSQGGTLSAEGATAAGMGDTGCPEGAEAGGRGCSRCGVLLSGGAVTAGEQMGCLEGVTATGTGEVVFGEGLMAGGTGKMGCPEGTTAGGTAWSSCGGTHPPCRASPGVRGDKVGVGMLSPIGDGGFPATQAEQNGWSRSGQAWGSPVPLKHNARGCSLVPPKHSTREPVHH